MNSSPAGTTWKEYKETRMTAGEREELKLKADIICTILESRHEQGLTQKQLEGKSGVKQSVIARLENGLTDPQLMTLLKVLRPLGKTLKIVPMDANTNQYSGISQTPFDNIHALGKSANE